MTRSTRRLLTVGTALGLALTTPGSCFPDDPPGSPGEARGTIVSQVEEPSGDGGTRYRAVVRDADGDEWTVRLPLDTPCRVDATYPDCAG